MSRQVSRGSARKYQADGRAGVARLLAEYHADERGEVARQEFFFYTPYMSLSELRELVMDREA